MSDDVRTPDSADDPTGQMFAALGSLTALPSHEFDALIESLSISHRRRRDMLDAVVAAAPSLTRDAADDALGAVIGYIAGWLAVGRPLDAIERRIVRGVNSVARTDDEALRRLLSAPGIRVTAGAVSAAQARGQEVANVQMRMDLSPVTTVDVLGSMYVPTFTLSIDFYNPGGEIDRRTTVAMDLDDLRKLKREVENRLDELESVRASLAAADVVIWTDDEIGDEDVE